MANTNMLSQARSQKFAMGGAVLRVWGRSPQLPEAGSLEAKPPAAGGTGVWGRSPSARKLCIFLQNNLILGLLLYKIMLLIRGIEINSAT